VLPGCYSGCYWGCYWGCYSWSYRAVTGGVTRGVTGVLPRTGACTSDRVSSVLRKGLRVFCDVCSFLLSARRLRQTPSCSTATPVVKGASHSSRTTGDVSRRAPASAGGRTRPQVGGAYSRLLKREREQADLSLFFLLQQKERAYDWMRAGNKVDWVPPPPLRVRHAGVMTAGARARVGA